MGELRVGVELGLSIPVPETEIWLKPTISILGIDPEGDVDAQLAIGIETAAKAFTQIEDHMEVAVSQIIAHEGGIPGFRDRLGAVEAGMSRASTRLNEVIKKLNESHEAAKELHERIERHVAVDGEN